MYYHHRLLSLWLTTVFHLDEAFPDHFKHQLFLCTYAQLLPTTYITAFHYLSSMLKFKFLGGGYLVFGSLLGYAVANSAVITKY